MKDYRLKIKDARRQAGVTLLLAILILSAILSISFSLTTIIFVHIRTSGDLLKSENTLYGASAISEEVIFNLKRNAGMSNYDLPAVNAFATSTVRSLNDNIIQVAVPPLGASGTFVGASVHYPIFNTSAPLGGSGYGQIKITYLKTGSVGNLAVYMCQFDQTKHYASGPCTDPSAPSWSSGSGYWLSAVGTGDALNNSTLVSQTYSLDSTMRQELILANYSSGTIYAQIEAWDNSGTISNDHRLGLPIFGQQVVDITSSFGGVSRKLRVSVPTTASSTAIAAPLFLINAGGGAYAGSGGKNWSADSNNIGGTTYGPVGNSIANTSDQTLYQSERWDSPTLHYSFPSVPNGTHTVILKFAEIYFGAPCSGQRVFNIVINSVTVQSNFDPCAAAGGPNIAVDRNFTVNVTGGTGIDIQLQSTGANNPKISAIEID